MSAKAVIERFGIPRSTLYQLVERGDIPCRIEEPAWRKKRRLFFNLDEVEAALKRLAEGKAKG